MDIQRQKMKHHVLVRFNTIPVLEDSMTGEKILHGGASVMYLLMYWKGRPVRPYRRMSGISSLTLKNVSW